MLYDVHNVMAINDIEQIQLALTVQQVRQMFKSAAMTELFRPAECLQASSNVLYSYTLLILNQLFRLWLHLPHS